LDNTTPSALGPLNLDLVVLWRVLLQPLRLEDVNMMVADVLHYCRTPEATMELSTLVYEKTKGNPFFTISFLTKLHQNSHIVRCAVVALLHMID
jgi:predicted ATPase